MSKPVGGATGSTPAFGAGMHINDNLEPVQVRESQVAKTQPDASSGPDRPAGAPDVRKAAAGDPVAASAMKAELSAKATDDPAKDYVSDYPISPGSQDKLETHLEKEDKSVGDRYDVEYHLEGSRTLTSSGLRQHLSTMNGGRPLTDFEKNLAAGWDKEDPMTTLTPIVKIGAEGVQAYALTKGGSGDRQTTYYDREGNVLGGPFHSEAGLVNEGLGPLEYVAGAMAVKGLIGGLFRFVRGVTAGEAVAGAVGKGMARSEGEAAASGNAAKTGKPSEWREGSGTSVHNPKPGSTPPPAKPATPKPAAPKPAAPKPAAAARFSQAEEEVIRSYMRAGKTRAQAEELVEGTREMEKEAKWVRPNSPNAGGTTRLPGWKIPGPGKKR